MAKGIWDINPYAGAGMLALATLLGGLFMAAITQSPERKYVNDDDNQCRMTNEVQRDDLDMVYCGKACLRPAVEYTYWCQREQKKIIFVE